MTRTCAVPLDRVAIGELPNEMHPIVAQVMLRPCAPLRLDWNACRLSP